ncbi:hypothetical protein D9C73_017765 [Collichthys lucidus]|uniref:Uncharacterized protein n=1 Tax=Collichthys lucidus TaxID=240159 RepID=A0A4V6AR98_COLLU|nr:hypothetical protein D9C73_017765 [Collichthys lucidus]
MQEFAPLRGFSRDIKSGFKASRERSCFSGARLRLNSSPPGNQEVGGPEREGSSSGSSSGGGGTLAVSRWMNGSLSGAWERMGRGSCVPTTGIRQSPMPAQRNFSAQLQLKFNGALNEHLSFFGGRYIGEVMRRFLQLRLRCETEFSTGLSVFKQQQPPPPPPLPRDVILANRFLVLGNNLRAVSQKCSIAALQTHVLKRRWD